MTKRADAHDLGLTSFVGRRADIAKGRHLLGGARLVTLVGPGGVGKTRLARRLRAEVARAFADGTFVVEMAELRDAEALASELAGAVGIEDVGLSPSSALAAYVRDRRLLVVFDNCEHLVEETGRLVHALLRAAPGLQVIATSRQPLGVAGEQLLVVEPLSLPSADASESEAVQLFVERARLVVPGFEPNDDDAGLVGRICTTLDGMPLAIELAAARMRVLSLVQLAERLDDRFGLLALTASTALPRHQTLRASVDWSFELCSRDEQTLWTWMSVFDGGCDLDAIEALCDGTGIGVFDVVAGLVDKSVLSPHEIDGRVRYRMLETLRAYGMERLDASDDPRLPRERHRAYFVELARSAGLAWFGHDQRELMARATVEHANLRAAFEASLAAPDKHQDALVIATSTWWYWVGHGGIDELLRWLKRALGVEQPATPLTMEAETRTALVAGMRGDHATVLTHSQRALDMSEGSVAPEVQWLRHWAQLYHALVTDPSPARLVEDSLHALGRLAAGPAVSPQEQANYLIALAQRRVLDGARGEEALRHIEDGIELCRRHGDQWNLSFLLCMKGSRLADRDRPLEALMAQQAALRLARDGFNAWTVLHALDAAAEILVALDEGRKAAVLFGALNAMGPDIGRVLRRADQPPRAALQQRTRELLGEVDFATEFDRGERLSLDAVVALVLDEGERPSQPSDPLTAQPTAELTRRELEVAELVARGLSNKEIATSLVVSPRTAEGHVSRVMNKLGFDSRARVAAWVAERHAGER